MIKSAKDNKLDIFEIKIQFYAVRNIPGRLEIVIRFAERTGGTEFDFALVLKMGVENRTMTHAPVERRHPICDAAITISEEEATWQNPKTAGEEHCAELMRERQKECEQEEQTPPLRNGESRERECDADEEWHLSIGGKQWEIESTMGKIWESTAYECIRRGETPGDVEIEKGRFQKCGLLYGEKDREFARRIDGGFWGICR